MASYTMGQFFHLLMVLEYLGYWNEKLRINEDIDMIKRFKKEFKLEYLNIPLYRYFKHEESMTHGGRN